MSGSDSGADPLARLADEFLERMRQGERPALSEYTARHPELAEQIREVFSALLVMEDVRPGPPSAADAEGHDGPTERPDAFRHARTLGPLALPAAGDRYQLLEEIGRGGMGAVLRARDPHLGRDLAVKVMRDDAHAKPELLHRFVEEAQVTGQLQHPGTVPVHDIGRLEDGRPFIAMKLIRGRTLAALLAERAGTADHLARFVGIFAQVCQTLAYAHSMGVLHRDLKPANVMVGAFGEVQVMDWGLAKVLRPRDGDRVAEDAETVLNAVRTLRSDTEGAQSYHGQTLGTPAYMAPEQARGEVDLLDERCDVFGLGAILCEILTGQPPFPGGSAHEVVGRAQAADLADAFRRLGGCGADAALVRLARGCLAPAPADRLRDAEAVAAAVTAYQDSVAQRLRQVELERAEAQVKAREERKRRKLWLGLAAVLLLLVAGGAGGAWWLQQRRQAADAAVGSRLAEARLLHAQARRNPLTEVARYTDALKAARQARELADTGGASPELRWQAEALVGVLEEDVKAAAVNHWLVTALIDEWPTTLHDNGMITRAHPSTEERYAAALRAWGLDVMASPTTEAAARLKKLPAGVRTEIVAALEEWAGRLLRPEQKVQRQRLEALVEALDDDPATSRQGLRALLASGTLTKEWRLGLASRALLPVSTLTDLVPGKERNRLRRLADATDPSTEPLLSLLTLKRALQEAGDSARAERLLRAAVQARPQEAVLYRALGSLLQQQWPPRWRDMVECYAAARAARPGFGAALVYALVRSGRTDEGLALSKRLVAERPDDSWAHHVRGLALFETRRYQEAEMAYRTALRLAPNDFSAQNDLGIVLASLDRPREAEAALREAIGLRPNQPVPYYNLGRTLYLQGRYKEAEVEFRTVLRLNFDALAVHVTYAAHYSLGAALSGQGRHKEAEAVCREALRLNPNEPAAYNNLGVALSGQGRHQEAEAACREALRRKPDDAAAYNNLGVALNGQGRHKEAEAACREALHFKRDRPSAHNDLGVALARQGRHQEAEAAFREAIRLKPAAPPPHYNLGRTLHQQGRPREAEEAFREALRLQADDPAAQDDLGVALRHQGRHKEAEVAHREAIRLKPDRFIAHHNLGVALSGQGRLKEAEAAFRAALRLKPDEPEPHNGLGAALSGQGRLKEAEAAYRAALCLQPDLPRAHYNLGLTLSGQGRLKEAEAAYRAAIRLQPDEPEAHNNLGAALGRQGRFKEAEAACREALRLKPDFALAHCTLGQALQSQGRFAEALACFKRGHELGSKDPHWSHPSKRMVEQAERFLALAPRLPAILQGKEKLASAAESLPFIGLCMVTQRYAAIARLCDFAFTADPEWAGNLRAGRRYSAACFAALAAAGRGADADSLDDKERARWRKQARDWLRADLAAWAKVPDRAVVQKVLRLWQQDGRLATVRDPAALAKLPQAERTQWQRLWADVETLLAGDSPAPP
jgi:serine/threonine-protein kinase